MLSRVKGIARVLGQVLCRSQTLPAARNIFSSNAAMRMGASRRMMFVPFRGFANYPDHKVMNMPNLSPTMTKGTISKWYKKEGDAFNPGDVICDVETDKATVGFEMVETGVLAKILVAAGTKDIPLGAPVFVIVDDAKDVAAFKDFKAAAAPAPAAAPKPEEKPAESKPEPKVEAPKPAAAPAAAPKAAPAPVAAPVSTPAPKPIKMEKIAGQEKFMTSPAARKIAAENNIDLASIKATGKGGRITKEDVVLYLEGGARAMTKFIPMPPQKQIIPGMPEYDDMLPSEHLMELINTYTFAKSKVPHFYVSVDCEMDKLLELRKFLNKFSKTKISINDMLVKVAAMACLKVKDANAAFNQTAIRYYKDVDMTVTVKTDGGVFTPVVSKANLKGFETIAKETKAFIKKARDGRLKPEEMMPGTFTISNVGMFGVKQAIDAVYAPQACTLGVGKIEKMVEPNMKKGDKEKAWRLVNKMKITLSSDHRVVDGAAAAQWTQEFKTLVETPNLLLL